MMAEGAKGSLRAGEPGDRQDADDAGAGSKRQVREAARAVPTHVGEQLGRQDRVVVDRLDQRRRESVRSRCCG